MDITLEWEYILTIEANYRNPLHRSPAIVIAYLMKHKQWRLPQAYQWVKDRRPSINLTQGMALEHISFLIPFLVLDLSRGVGLWLFCCNKTQQNKKKQYRTHPLIKKD